MPLGRMTSLDFFSLVSDGSRSEYMLVAIELICCDGEKCCYFGLLGVIIKHCYSKKELCMMMAAWTTSNSIALPAAISSLWKSGRGRGGGECGSPPHFHHLTPDLRVLVELRFLVSWGLVFFIVVVFIVVKCT